MRNDTNKNRVMSLSRAFWRGYTLHNENVFQLRGHDKMRLRRSQPRLSASSVMSSDCSAPALSAWRSATMRLRRAVTDDGRGIGNACNRSSPKRLPS